MSTVARKQFTCCPQFWDDQRSESSEKGVVDCLLTGDRHGSVTRDKNNNIRLKMLALFPGSMAIYPVQTALRIGHLFSKHWIRQGTEEATKDWKATRRTFAVTDPSRAPDRAQLQKQVALRCIYRLSEAVAKLITLPIAAVLATLASLIGIVDPVLGRFLYGWVEETWSVDLGEWSAFNNFANFIAPCMLPQRVVDKLNFYKAWPDYDPNTIRARIVALFNLLTANSDYNQAAPLLEQVRNFRKTVRTITLSDQEEIEHAQNPLKSQVGLIEIRDLIQELTESYSNYMTLADQLADQKIDHPSERSEELSKQLEAHIATMQLRFATLGNPRDRIC
ncbi:MAG: hypothetical protein JSS32_03205 [Verrucomicrobia bacterium]|nr:hypothetical protein [Verrucomicrobiota bacterium]